MLPVKGYITKQSYLNGIYPFKTNSLYNFKNNQKQYIVSFVLMVQVEISARYSSAVVREIKTLFIKNAVPIAF